MKKFHIFVLVVVASILATACDKKDSADGVTEEQKALVSEILNESFKTAVPAMMKKVQEVAEEKGPAGAVGFCNENVAGMGKKMTGKLQEKFVASHHIESFQFGRTSDRLRNPANAPDEAKKAVLNRWLEQEKKGEKASDVIYRSGDSLYGMKPIRIMSPLCLKCHGTPETLDADAVAVIDEKYPEDHARGYGENDLRGAFWVKVKLP